MHKILYVASILYANLQWKYIDINNGSVLNDKSIKAQGSDEYW